MKNNMEGKVVKMEEKKNESADVESKNPQASSTAPQKLSYEQLASAAQQLSEQGRQLYIENQELRKRLEESNLQNLYKKLDYLWAVINSDTIYLTEDFKYSCAEEFSSLLQGNAPVEEEEKQASETEQKGE